MTVSVLIATYNSSKYIIDTLNSVFRQTYPLVELIISDDCSTDNTLSICQEWIAAHSDRFSNVACVKTEHNLGIAGNYNNALAQASGEWVKCLDSDDLLLPNCIETFVEATKRQPEMKVWYSGWEIIRDDGTLLFREPNTFPIATARKQLRSYLVHIQDLHTNTMFIRTDTLRSVGGFDMRYPMTQDIPLTYCLMVHGITLGILPEEYTMQFRFVPDSVSRSSHPVMNDNIAACRYYYSKYFLRYGMILRWYNAAVTYFLHEHHNKGRLAVLLGYMLRLTDIMNWYFKIKHHLKARRHHQ